MRRRDEVAVGILMTVSTAILIIGTIWLLRGGLSSGYPLYTRFKWGQNLRQGQPVVLAGVGVGYVADVTLQQNGYLSVLLRVNNQYKIPYGSTATVQPVGLFGDVQVALTPPGPSTKAYQPGDTVPAGIPSPGMNEVLARADTIGTNVQTITVAMQREMVQAGAIRDLHRTITSALALSGQLQALVAQQNENLTRTMESFRHATGTLDRAAGSLDTATIDSTLRNLRSTTANASQLALALDSSAVKLNAILSQVQRGQGTAGKVLRDTLLYEDIRRTTHSLDSLLTDLRLHPGRYINVHIF